MFVEKGRGLRVFLTGVIIMAAAAASRGQEGGDVDPDLGRDPDTILDSTCDRLRTESEPLPDVPDQYSVVEVTGMVAAVDSDEALSYLVLCAPPQPQVLCVTYSTNGLQVGDVAVVRGGYSRRSPDHVLLDPCLGSKAE